MASFSKKQALLVSAALLLICAAIGFFYFRPGISQNKTESSLKALLRDADKAADHDPVRAEREATKAFELSRSSSDPADKVQALLILGKLNNIKGNKTESMNLYLQARELAAERSLHKELCEVMVRIGEIKYKRGDYHQSLRDFMYADSVAAVSKLEPLRAYTLYYIGKYNQTTGNFQKSSRYYYLALNIAKKYNDKRLLTLILPSLGKYYISEGKLHLALQTYLEALNISRQLSDYLLNADVCNHLGGLYLQMNEYNKALTYHKKALEFRNEMNNPEGLAKSYNNIGRAYLELRKLDSALFYFKESLLICRGVDYKKGMIKAQINLAHTYILQKQSEKGRQFLNDALDLSNKISYDAGIAESALGMGELYSQLQQPDSAIHYYKVSLDKLSKTGYDEELRNVYQGLYNCYNLKGDYQNALNYHIALLDKEKKLLNVENNRQLALLNITFDTERKEKNYQVLLKDNALKESEIKSKNTALWLIIALLGFTLLLCLYIYNRFYIKKKANKLLEELNQRITLQNAELEKLNKELEQVSKEKDKLFSIISHELRNPLYWLQNLAEVLSQKYKTMPPEKIRKTLSSLDESAKNVYHLMDNLLYWSRAKLNRIHPRKSQYNLHTLVCETTQMFESFLEQKEIILQNKVPANLIIYADPNLFSCVVRNLISNAIKYTPNGGCIDISCSASQHHVTLAISDSGKGISHHDLQTIFDADNGLSMPGLMQEKGSGLGLKLCKDFVEMNEGKIWAESNPGQGTQFYFTVPLQSAVTKDLYPSMSSVA